MSPLPSTSSGPSSSATEGAATSTSEPYFDTTAQKWMVETAQGTELEWDQTRNAWVPLVDEDLVKKQQAAYSVQGVDETEEVTPLSKEERKKQSKKRKAQDSDDPTAKRARQNTAVYLSNLPPTTTVEQIEDVFSKAGLILQDATNHPRIKLYTDPATGQFKREALVVYLQKESVELAVRLFDQTELVLGSGHGLITVQEAQWDDKKEVNQDADKKHKDERAKKTGKKAAALRQKLEDWSSSDEDDAKTSKKLKGVVVLEGMFTLAELEEDPTLLLDLKEDVREECESLGTVTNVTLYDKEEQGIMTVRFKEELSAQACIAKMSGRFFAGRTVQAYPMTSKHKFVKSNKGDDDLFSTAPATTSSAPGTTNELGTDSVESREQERQKAYAEWLEKGEQ
ncbi:U2 snRNP complex subunit CUS2 [Sporobolomyces koalae]|uniref:U2 snRNP complex subunit CUS2 n=1 Tax=Sporobolomyces koalae TaxID=500713 RepID=UPI0031769F9A